MPDEPRRVPTDVLEQIGFSGPAVARLRCGDIIIDENGIERRDLFALNRALVYDMGDGAIAIEIPSRSWSTVYHLRADEILALADWLRRRARPTEEP